MRERQFFTRTSSRRRIIIELLTDSARILYLNTGIQGDGVAGVQALLFRAKGTQVGWHILLLIVAVHWKDILSPKKVLLWFSRKTRTDSHYTS